jgi:hypothetical protein
MTGQISKTLSVRPSGHFLPDQYAGPSPSCNRSGVCNVVNTYDWLHKLEQEPVAE